MQLRVSNRPAKPRQASGRTGFTLVELLVVIAIIVLLIGLIAPSLSGARDQARAAKIANTLKGIGDGMELFRGQNEEEFHGYPPSALADDPTESGTNELWGAQWAVRYLMGKDLNGYIPRRAVPSNMFNDDPDYTQKDWYSDAPSGNNGESLQRVQPYVPRDGVKVKQVGDLPGLPGENAPELTPEQEKAPVFVDDYNYPILYYRANPRMAARANAPIARPTNEDPAAIYTFEDNDLFTGHCMGSTCLFSGWDFGSGSDHPIDDFGPEATPDTRDLKDYPWVYYILDKNSYNASANPNDANAPRTANPHNRDRFILISAGKDGLYGTQDDVKNF